MYGLYSAYGGITKIYWWLFRNCKLIRWINRIDEKDLDFPYTLIKEIDGTDALMSFNTGHPGEEQKISILGYDNQIRQPFFVKFSQKPEAMELSRNEINILKQLSGSGFTPALLADCITPEYVYLKTEYVKGKRLESTTLTKDITALSIRLSQLSLTNNTDTGLQASMSHGDFCPWNFLENEGDLRLIDWEMAAIRPLGYDLFTYIFQPAFLLFPKESIENIIKKNTIWIDGYFSSFDIKNWIDYLIAFADAKLSMGTQNNNIKLVKYYQHYQQLKNYAETL
jgi:tRNA A-37 threonylcarbamoyl transferase component Bud32